MSAAGAGDIGGLRLILWPHFGAVLWGTIVAILFAPLFRRLTALMGQRRMLAGFVTLVIIVVMVILPLTLVRRRLTAPAVTPMVRARGKATCRGDLPATGRAARRRRRRASSSIVRKMRRPASARR